MEGDTAIRTIGYGARSIDEFVSALQTAGADYLVYVRSAPYSRFKPEFSKEPLAAALDQHGIRYVFMGDSLGGRPDDPGSFREDGRVDYERRRVHPEFQEGIGSLDAGWEAGHRIVLMCSEGKPQECHRAKLVAEELVAERTHREIMDSLTDGQETLFGANAAAAGSRKQYRVA